MRRRRSHWARVLHYILAIVWVAGICSNLAVNRAKAAPSRPDWNSVTPISDPVGDCNGCNGNPNDFAKVFFASDGANVYVRYDVILTGNYSSSNPISSVQYALALTTGTGSVSHAAPEARAFVVFNSHGDISLKATGYNSPNTSSNTIDSSNAQISYSAFDSNLNQTVASIEAAFPFAAFNGTGGYSNRLVAAPLNSSSIVPLWAEPCLT